jgi:hypothetical protein
MATLFSDHFNSSGTVGPGQGALTEELGLDSQRKISAGLGGARLRYKKAKVTVGTVAGIGDQIRMMTMKSNDRIIDILFGTDGLCTNGTADLGWYLRGLQHNGALPSTNSVDAFSTSALAIKTATVAATGGLGTRNSIFESGDYDTEDIGKMVWELINVSDAATYASDPGGEFDLTFTVVEAVTAAVVTVQLEVLYTSGD